MSVAVRRATATDCQAILELYRQVDDMHVNLASHTYRRLEEPIRTQQWTESLIGDPQSLLLVAESHRIVAGLLEAVASDTKPLPFLVQKRFVTVNTLIVDERFRRQRVGRALMAAAQNWARVQGAEELRLTVYEANEAALGFYQALGFTTVKRDLRLPIGG